MKTYIDNRKRENLVITGINYKNGTVDIVVTDSIKGVQYQRKITPEFIKLLCEFDSSIMKQIDGGIIDNEMLIKNIREIFGDRRKAISFNGIFPE
jgi:NurA-like 5'-3' nuclease